MKGIARWGWGAELVLVTTGLAGFNSLAAGQGKGPRPTFTIRVRNYAGIPPQTLAEARRTAITIFQRAGIEARWAEIEVDESYAQRARVPEPLMTLADMQVNIFPDTAPIPAGVSDHVMGVAPGAGPDRTVVDVFAGRVRSLFLRISSAYLKGDIERPVSEGELLGHVIAHEVGHLLLNQPGHSPRGIMRGEWVFGDFRDMASGLLLFDSQQAQLLCAEAARRSAHERTDVATAESHSKAR